ncbi:MAG: stage V sporulation protein SpoVM [Ruminococcus sp.]|nr:stage V sporulation protein SpoVM [Ruminococcus sp.]
MKIVVVRSPKLLSGIFRIVFKIKKDTLEETE